jgi:hypothetical protein
MIILPLISSLLNSKSSSKYTVQIQLFYRSISELQEQNQKLLAVVRELSDAQEQKEMETGDTKSVYSESVLFYF